MTTTTPYQVLLIHGFTGTSHDLAPLYDALTHKGMTVVSQTLKGHESTPKDLSRAHMEDWISNAKDALARLNPDRPKIIIALSMGTFLATLLAADKKNRVDAIVLLSPAFVLTWPGRVAAFLSGFGLHRVVPFISKRNGSDICEPEARRTNRSYKKIPVRALAEFDKLRQLATGKLKDVSCPVYIGFGNREHTVDIARAKKVLQKLGSSRVHISYFTNSAHILPLDFDRDKLCGEVAQFIETIK